MENLKPAAQCIGLRALIVINNELVSLNGGENLTNLLVLDVWGNKIKSLQGIKKLKKLESLDVSDNRLTELKLVKSLTQLKQLDVSYNRIQKLADLSKMKNLKILDLSHNLLMETDYEVIRTKAELQNFKQKLRRNGYKDLKKSFPAVMHTYIIALKLDKRDEAIIDYYKIKN